MFLVLPCYLCGSYVLFNAGEFKINAVLMQSEMLFLQNDRWSIMNSLTVAVWCYLPIWQMWQNIFFVCFSWQSFIIWKTTKMKMIRLLYPSDSLDACVASWAAGKTRLNIQSTRIMVLKGKRCNLFMRPANVAQLVSSWCFSSCSSICSVHHLCFLSFNNLMTVFFTALISTSLIEPLY